MKLFHIILGCVFLGCSLFSQAGAAEAKQLRVVTSIPPLYSFAVNIAGDRADVENLLPGGVGPHDYQFSRKDIQKLKEADVLIINGLGLESWLNKAIAVHKPSQIIEAAAGLEKRLIEAPHDHSHDHGSHDHHHSDFNPHIWLDPELAAHCATNILLALQKADPASGEYYQKKAAQFVERLQKLDIEIKGMLAAVKDRPFITYHDAFPYLVRRYELKQVGVVEEVPDVSPSPKYLTKLGNLIRKNGVKVIFTEPQFSSKLVKQLSKDFGIGTAELDPLETGLLSPSSYEDGMRKNARVLLQALLKK